ncbi:MAG: VacJ family lipoprotein [Candidatus Midichloria sp.]|uniref:VacJ family lipoprotein n=1 Tax=Hyalomma marginatum TaxID=34627 RepID=A0A8S4C2A2_9ACAR|nr:VacJ family lipoprotein [Hyalomma marginatum]CAG7592355.1 VacJ family lipoprotein [Hyalomma marginatum]
MAKVVFYSILLLFSSVLCGCSGKYKAANNQEPSAQLLQQVEDASTNKADEDWRNARIVTYSSGKILTADYKEDMDPLEPFNRMMFKINKGLDDFLIRPIAIMYDRTVPDWGKDSIQNFLQNLFTPLQMIYGILSLNPEMISRFFARFVINTTFGTLGLHDAASRYPELRFEEFRGENVLKRYGGKSGPYIVLPVVGPSSARGAFGLLLDFAANPLNYTLKRQYIFSRDTLVVIDKRADLLKITDNIDEVSIDEYITTRSIYSQNRR